ncbi:MAG TPA: DUF1508 domain-containing protein [Kofleriaceae bacterium]|nr:DUF1508 domain-containing protein [Kofleriaceae bacterium]
MKTFALLAALALATPACMSADDATTDTASDELAGAPHFDLWTDTAGAYHFHLKAGNSQILVTSQAYSSRMAALNGILSVLDNGGLASHYETLIATNGQRYFNLVASNKQTIATSETYSSKAAAQKGVNATIAAVGAYIERWDNGTGARFHVFPGKDGRYYFSLYAKNGAIVLQSQGYSSEAAALNGTFAVAENGTSSAQWRVLAAGNGGYYLNLVAANNEIVGTSEVYTTKQSAETARDSIIALIPTVALL